MTFTWKTPPWERYEDTTHMAVMLTAAGGGQVSLTAEAVRGDEATEALADLLMGPGAAAAAAVVAHPGLIGVLVRPGIDVMWMAQPPIEVSSGNAKGEWNIVVTDGSEATMFSADDTRDLLARLRAEYGGK